MTTKGHGGFSAPNGMSPEEEPSGDGTGQGHGISVEAMGNPPRGSFPWLRIQVSLPASLPSFLPSPSLLFHFHPIETCGKCWDPPEPKPFKNFFI